MPSWICRVVLNKESPTRVLAFALYGDQAASTRVRLLQYLPALAAANVQLDVQILLDNDYLQAMFAGQKISPWRLVQLYAQRLAAVWRARHYDRVWIHMELFPNLPALFEWLLAKCLCPYIYDCDDAFFHKYDLSHNPFKRLLSKKIDRIMAHAQQVVCGNAYLAQKAQKAGAKRWHVVPSVVDTDLYQPLAASALALAATPVSASDAQPLRIGWIGSRTTAKYLLSIMPVLALLSKKYALELVVVGAQVHDSAVSVRSLPWQKATEIADIQSFDIGIMPLDNSPWELGKCAFKLIQCMACGVPVVGSRVGANCELIQDGANGLLASSAFEWEAAFDRLLSDRALRQRLGAAGRATVTEQYSLQSQSKKVARIFLNTSAEST
jgi:glycosyltransferase involved in cell wall biosynthesis